MSIKPVEADPAIAFFWKLRLKLPHPSSLDPAVGQPSRESFGLRLE